MAVDQAVFPCHYVHSVLFLAFPTLEITRIEPPQRAMRKVSHITRPRVILNNIPSIALLAVSR